MITGNLGYIGPIMTKLFMSKGHFVIGLDSGLYKSCFMEEYTKPDIQLIKDIRDVNLEDLADIDYIIHLAGLSNDPLGDFDEDLTFDINYRGTIYLAKLACAAGVKRFIYASSQSVYGVSATTGEVNELSATNPITAYAKSKLLSEEALSKLSSKNFSCTSLRPATAYGSSPNFRYDIVLNALTADAHSSGVVIVKSDGTPWRPMSHVNDISKAFLACVEAPLELVENKIFNVGTSDNNYTVKDLAEEVSRAYNFCKILYTNEHLDSRSYRVSSQKILTELKGYYTPTESIQSGIKELKLFYERLEDGIPNSGQNRIRLLTLKDLVARGLVDKKLRFTNH
jgi:nucleoside-diphosphate-sugar epimerase